MYLKRMLIFGLTILLLGGIITSVFLSCKHEADILNLTDSICFESQILPIFQSSCAISGCHDSPGNESEFVFTDYLHIMEAVTPGDPMKSPAYTSLISVYGEEGLMPPGQPLSKQNRTMIRVWIEKGALNINCQQACDTISVMTFTGSVWPIIELNCQGCHRGASPSGGLLLTNYCEVALQAASGHLTGVMRGGIYPLMPPSGTLPECQIRQVELWIQGDQDTLCTQNPDTTEYQNPRACFQRDILPILQSSCAISGCHDGNSTEIDYVFTNYTNTMLTVIPGNPSESKLYNVITTAELGDKMPPAPYPSLSTASIDSIYSWISYGALNEYCGEACDTVSSVTFSGIIWPIIELNCRGCHGGGTPSGGVLLTNYTQIAAQATNGKLTGVLRDGTYSLMPPSGSLSECRIRQVELWVEAGIQNNK